MVGGSRDQGGFNMCGGSGSIEVLHFSKGTDDNFCVEVGIKEEINFSLVFWPFSSNFFTAVIFTL